MAVVEGTVADFCLLSGRGCADVAVYNSVNKMRSPFRKQTHL